MEPIKGTVRTFEVVDGVGEIALEDGRVARFGASRIGYQGDLRTLPGLPVEVTELAVGPGGTLRVVAGSVDVEALTRAPATWAEARPRLRLQVALAGTIDSDVVAETAGPGFVLALVATRGGHELHIVERHLDAWGVTRDDAVAAAALNLRALAPSLRPLRPGTYSLERLEGYAAACLFRTGVLDGAQTSGPPVVLVPHRDHVFVTGTDDVEGLRLACSAAQAALLGDLNGEGRVATRVIGGPPRALVTEHALSGRASVRMGTEWYPFEPVPHPLEELLVATRQLGDAIAANLQEERLRKAHPDVDVHIARVFRGLQDDPGSFFVSWTEGARAWLPEAPFVLFITDEELEAKARTRPWSLVAWDRVRAELGESMRPLGVRPERWEVNAFPSPESLRRLESDAT